MKIRVRSWHTFMEDFSAKPRLCKSQTGASELRNVLNINSNSHHPNLESALTFSKASHPNKSKKSSVVKNPNVSMQHSSATRRGKKKRVGRCRRLLMLVRHCCWREKRHVELDRWLLRFARQIWLRLERIRKSKCFFCVYLRVLLFWDVLACGSFFFLWLWTGLLF